MATPRQSAVLASAALVAALAGCSLFTDLGGLEEGQLPGGADAAAEAAAAEAGVTPGGGGDASTKAVDAGPDAPTCVLSGTVEALVASPGTVVEGALGGTSWSNPSNARHADGLFATVPMNGGNVTRRLLAKGFGFVVPVGAVVRGVTVKVRRRSDSANAVVDDAVALVRSGVVSPVTKSAPGAWPVQLATATYGGPADTWGETWTPSDVSSLEFGVAVAARGVDAVAVEAAVDHIEVTVHVERCKP